jgi:protein-disulfide isomerase
MVTLGRWVVMGSIVLAAACGGGGSSSEHSPAAVSDDTLKEAVVGYFQRAVTQPGLEIEVTDLAEAPVPGMRKGTLAATLNGERKELGFYVTNDGHWLIQGEMTDLTVDPQAELMKKIVLDGQPSRGPDDAKVTIVEYSDFQCPFCGRAYETLEKEVLPAYGDRVRFVFKNLPLTQIHPWAQAAAIASECAFRQGNDQFWTLYNGFFTQQKDITVDNLTDKAMAIAEGSGIDTDALRTCIEGKQSLDAVKADDDEATEIGVTSTPTFIINGKRVSGAQTFESFKAILDQQLGTQG